MSKTSRPAGSPPQAASRTRGKPVLPRDIKVMLVAAFLIALGFGLVAPVLPQFATTFDVGATAAAVIVSIFAFMRLVFAPAGGALIVRLGERPVYVAGLLIVAASTAACAFAQDYWQLLVFRGLGGAGSVMFTVASMALVVRLAPPESRGRVSGAYASAFLIGNVCGPVVGGLLAGFGLRVPFLVYAAALVLAALVVQTQLSHVPAASRPDGGTAPAMELREALRDSAYRAGLFSSFANGWATFGVRMATVPLFAVAALNAGPESAGWALAVFAAANAVALTFSGKLADSLGRKPHDDLRPAGHGHRHGGHRLHARAALVPARHRCAPASAQGCSGPAQQAAMADVIGNERSGGRVLAIFQMTADSGAIIGPVLAGLLADRLGYGWAFGVTGGVLVAAAAGWLLARETFRRPAPQRLTCGVAATVRRRARHDLVRTVRDRPGPSGQRGRRPWLSWGLAPRTAGEIPHGHIRHRSPGKPKAPTPPTRRRGSRRGTKAGKRAESRPSWSPADRRSVVAVPASLVLLSSGPGPGTAGAPPPHGHAAGTRGGECLPAPAVTYYKQPGPPAGSPLEKVEPLEVNVSKDLVGTSLNKGLVGISLEATDLADPALSSDNASMVKLLKEADQPVLRSAATPSTAASSGPPRDEAVPARLQGRQGPPGQGRRPGGPGPARTPCWRLPTRRSALPWTWDTTTRPGPRIWPSTQPRSSAPRLLSFTVGNEPNGFGTQRCPPGRLQHRGVRRGAQGLRECDQRGRPRTCPISGPGRVRPEVVAAVHRRRHCRRRRSCRSTTTRSTAATDGRTPRPCRRWRT